jgi:hypothetical protein
MYTIAPFDTSPHPCRLGKRKKKGQGAHTHYATCANHENSSNSNTYEGLLRFSLETKTFLLLWEEEKEEEAEVASSIWVAGGSHVLGGTANDSGPSL